MTSSIPSLPTSSTSSADYTPSRLFEVRAGRYVFPARLEHTPDNWVQLDVAVPARKKVRPCITFVIDPNNPSEVVMENVEYNSECGQGLDKDGRRSPSADMVRIACIAARRLLAPAATTVVFSDRSGFPCDPYDNVQLAPHNVLLYGRTWYQRVLPCAVPQASTWRDRLRIAMQQLKSTVPPFDDFWQTAFGQHNFSLPRFMQGEGFRSAVHDVYNGACNTSSCSWNDVFVAINKKIGCWVFPYVIQRLALLERNEHLAMYVPEGLAWQVQYDGSGGMFADNERRLAEIGLERWVEQVVGEVHIDELSQTGGGGKVLRARNAIKAGIDACAAARIDRSARCISSRACNDAVYSSETEWLRIQRKRFNTQPRRHGTAPRAIP